MTIWTTISGKFIVSEVAIFTIILHNLYLSQFSASTDIETKNSPGLQLKADQKVIRFCRILLKTVCTILQQEIGMFELFPERYAGKNNYKLKAYMIPKGFSKAI